MQGITSERVRRNYISYGNQKGKDWSVFFQESELWTPTMVSFQSSDSGVFFMTFTQKKSNWILSSVIVIPRGFRRTKEFLKCVNSTVKAKLGYLLGRDVHTPEKFTPNQSKWRVDDVIDHGFRLTQTFLNSVDPTVHKNFVDLLRRDVYSEGDASALYEYIMTRRREMSAEFLAMLEPWLSDELKHYEAMRRANHAISGTTYAEMDSAFEARVHEIEPLLPVLEDEFHILLLLAFDELGSTYSYRRDVQDYYRHYGPEIYRVGRWLMKDEGVHFDNAIAVLKLRHSHRLSEAPGVLEAIDNLEQSLHDYSKVFFLDHSQERDRFPRNFNKVLIEVILARLGLAQHPVDTQELWKWRPEGCNLVPIAPPEGASRY